jgi:signal transduction histidine kinase
VNKRTADYLGLPKDHPLRFGIDIGAKWDAHIPLLHPDEREESRKAWSTCLRKGEAAEFSQRVRNAQGDYRWFLSRVEPLRADDGSLLQWVGVNLDIEELKCAEQALRESEGKFRDYAETASDWFWEIGPDYKFTLLTENAFGSHAADRLGTACWEHALDLESEPEKWRLVRAALDSRQPFRDFVYCSARRNDSPIYVKASGKPVFGANGEFRGYRGTGTDVTAVVRAREEHERLRELESQLAHVNRVSVMGELAASLVHEITQPIATARNNARAAMNFLARNRPDLGEVREALACVVGDTDRAGKIIDGVRGHIKKAPLRKDRFDLNDAIREVIALARTAIIKNGVAVHTRLTEGPLAVEGDRVQLQQVALNLVLNAAEAMSSVEAGARNLLISTERSQSDEIVVAVRDSGPGIDPKDRERVFETFYTTKSGGTGMGLSISRSIVAAHGGRLWADMNAPRGAVFKFTLPAAAKDSRILLGRLAGPQRRAEALQQTRLVNGLSKVADDSIAERAGPVGVVGVGSDEDRRNPVSGTDEVFVELDSGHRRHMDVSDQAGGFGETRGCEEIGSRRESLDAVAQRPHEPSHRLAKQLVVLDQRDQ